MKKVNYTLCCIIIIALISQSINAQSKIISKNISKEHFESIKNIGHKPSFILRTTNINGATKSVLFGIEPLNNVY